VGRDLKKTDCAAKEADFDNIAIDRSDLSALALLWAVYKYDVDMRKGSAEIQIKK
jgi:hypothetical protein